MFAVSLGWFLLTRLNVWMVFLAEWRTIWLIWWDSAFAEASRRVWRSKAHAYTKRCPKRCKQMDFSLFPRTKWWKHCWQKAWKHRLSTTATRQLRLWGAARSTDKRVAANYYFGEETQWPHSWPEQGRKGTQVWEMDRYNEQTSESMRIGEFASMCQPTFNHHLDEICCWYTWYTLTCQVSSPICMPSSDVLGSRRGLPKSFSCFIYFQGLWDLKDFFTTAMKHAWWVGVVLGKPGKAQSVGLHLYFQGSRQTASCRQIDFLKYCQSMWPGPWVGSCANWGSERRNCFLKKQWCVTLLASVLA